MSSIATSWTRIEAWLAARPGRDYGVNPPASAQDLTGLMAVLKSNLPIELVESLQRHNGQRFNASSFLGQHVLLSTNAVIKTFGTLQKVAATMGYMPSRDIKADRGIKKMWWNEKWVPFAMAEPRDQLMIDLDPGLDGTYGQVIQYWGDDSRRTVVAPSFEAWLASQTGKLK